MRLVVLLSGRGSNFIALHNRIQQQNLPIEIVLVISDKSDAQGLLAAKELGLATKYVPREPQLKSASQFNTELAEATLAAKPDFIILAGFMRILSGEFVRCFENKIINIHPSLLPSFPGTHAQRQALEAGVKFSGCTVHLVAEAVDAGPILAQAVVPVLSSDDENSLSARILKQEHRILPAVVEAICRGMLDIGNGRPSWKKGSKTLDSDLFLCSLPIAEDTANDLNLRFFKTPERS